MSGGPARGCDMRAHLIGTSLQAFNNVSLGKIWCWGENWLDDKADGSDVSVVFAGSYDPCARTHSLTNNFHVAVFAQRPGRVPLVFDPVYYDGPVTMEQWQEDFVSLLGERLTHTVSDFDTHFLDVQQAVPKLKTNFYIAARFEPNMRLLKPAGGDVMRDPPPGRSRWLQEVRQAA